MDDGLARVAEFFEWLSDAWVQAPERLGFPPEWILFGLAALYVGTSLVRTWPTRRRIEAGMQKDLEGLRRHGPHSADDAGPDRRTLGANWAQGKAELEAFIASRAAEASGASDKPQTASRRTDLGFLGQPPRSLSPALTIRVLFGGLQQAGWLVFGFGMLFAVALVGRVEIAWSLRAGTVAQADARALEYFETDAAENDISIYGTRYAFDVSGRSLEGVSYATGHYLEPGEAARVEYAIDDPQWSRIVGMRSAAFGPGVLLVLLFPAVGAALIAFSLRGRVRELRLLRGGQLAFGRLTEKRPTNSYINKQPVYELRYEFRTRDGRTATASTMTHRPAELENEAEEALLYDPHDPARNVMYDAMPGRPQISPGGALSLAWGGALRVLILPALAVGVNGLLVWLKWGG